MQAYTHYKKMGSGIPVMLVPGFGEDASIWDAQTKVLENDCTLLIPDLRGTGKASSSSLPASIEAMAADLLSILDAEKIQACILLGHSMGGYITLAFAEMYPERLLAFGLIHSTTYADTEEKKEMRRKAIAFINTHESAAFLKTSTPNLFSESFQREHASIIANLIEKSSTLQPSVFIAHYQAIMARPDRTHVLAESKVPVLMVIGKEDKAVNPADAQAQSKLNPLCTAVILDTGHMSMLEAPEELNLQIMSFIDKVSKATRIDSL